MERALSQEERIRRAEEIRGRRYENRHNMEYVYNKKCSDNRNMVHSGDVKKKIAKKMIVQILVCSIIYFSMYIISNLEHVFSSNIIEKAKEILSYDVSFSELKENEAIKKVRDTIENFVKITVNKDEESLNAVVNSENLDVDGTVQDNNLIENIEAIGGAEDKIEEEASVLEEPKTQEEQDIEYVKQNANIIWPLKGVITSRFGTREATEIVTPNHHGIDIAGNTGADIIAAMDGIVTQNSSEGDYGKHLRIEGNGVLTLYAHCSKLLVNEGEAVKQGQKIAEVGSTGRATGPHLHFEIRRDNRYINPESILENLWKVKGKKYADKNKPKDFFIFFNIYSNKTN